MGKMGFDYIMSGFSLLLGLSALVVSLVFWKINHKNSNKKGCNPPHTMKEVASTKE